MSYQATVIDIFLSSPDDVKAEREFVVRTAAEWNQLRGRDSACFMSILTWEDFVAPALMDRPQEVINQQIGDNYDVYLGIMWTKFGTPTGTAQSGTEEEFLNALDRVTQGGRVRIATMFKTSDIQLSNIDANQLVKVQQFKSRISEQGAFYREFGDNNSLRSALNLLFEQISRDRKYYNSVAQKAKTDSTFDEAGANTSVGYVSSNNEDSQDGLFEVGEKFATTVSSFSVKLKAIMEAENENNAEVSACTGELSQMIGIKSIDTIRAKTVFRRVSASMNVLAEKYESLGPDIESDALLIAHLIDADLSLRFKVDDWQKSGKENLEAAIGFSATLTDAISHLEILSNVTDSIPPLSGEVNRAKIKLGMGRRKFLDIFKSLEESTSNSVEFFTKNK